MWSSSDEALLAGLAAGDRDAAAAFVRRFQARVYGLALTIVRDRGTAEDVAQETFLRAWRHAASYDARRARVVTWLLTIARNAAIDAARPKSAEPVEADAHAARLQLSQPPGEPDAAPAPDERDRLRSAIADLPPDQRRPLVLAAYLGFTGREISEADGLPLGTVKTRIRTAMMRLHDALEGSHDV